MTGVENYLRGGRSDVGIAETGADLKRGRNEVGGVSNNYGVAGFDSDFRRVSGIGFGAAITGLEFWLERRGHIKRGSATSINNAFLLLDDIC